MLKNESSASREGELLGEAVEMRKKTSGEKHPSTLASMNNLASICRNQGRRKEAKEIEMRNRVLERNKPIQYPQRQ